MTENTKASAPLSCPFCAGSDIRFDAHTDWQSPTGKIWSMCCYQCGATFPNRYRKELLLEKWNTRSVPAQLPLPDGYVLMPREATRTMTMAACDYLPACEHVFGFAGEMLRNCYRKMVEVAAITPTESQPVEDAKDSAS